MVKTCFRRAQPGGDILEVTYEKIYSYNLRHVRVGCHGCQQRQLHDHAATTARSAKLSHGERTAQTGVWMLCPSHGCNETPSRGRDVCNHWTLCPLHPGLSPDKHHTNITRSTHNNNTMNTLCPLHPGLSPDKHHTNITRSTHNNNTMNTLCPLHLGLSPDKYHTNVTRSTHNNNTTSSIGVCWLAEFVGEVRLCYTLPTLVDKESQLVVNPLRRLQPV